MQKYLELLEQLAAVEAERVKISDEGKVLFDCWLAQSKPSGTARTANTYWQLRSRQPQFAGKKSKYVRASEIGQYKAAIARGRRVKQLDRKIAVLQRRISKIENLLAAI